MADVVDRLAARCGVGVGELGGVSPAVAHVVAAFNEMTWRYYDGWCGESEWCVVCV